MLVRSWKAAVGAVRMWDEVGRLSDEMGRPWKEVGRCWEDVGRLMKEWEGCGKA